MLETQRGDLGMVTTDIERDHADSVSKEAALKADRRQTHLSPASLSTWEGIVLRRAASQKSGTDYLIEQGGQQRSRAGSRVGGRANSGIPGGSAPQPAGTLRRSGRCRQKILNRPSGPRTASMGRLRKDGGQQM